MTGEYPTQRAGNAENFHIWWRHQNPKSKRQQIATSVEENNGQRLNPHSRIYLTNNENALIAKPKSTQE